MAPLELIPPEVYRSTWLGLGRPLELALRRLDCPVPLRDSSAPLKALIWFSLVMILKEK